MLGLPLVPDPHGGSDGQATAELDALLKLRDGAKVSTFTWLRSPPGAPATQNILLHIEQLRCIRRSLLANFAFAKKFMQGFVLVRGNVVDSGAEGSTPSLLNGFERAEIVAAEPAEGAKHRGGRAVERVEAYPEVVSVGVVDEGPEAGVAGWGPIAGIGLAAGFDDLPGVVPPPAIVIGGLGLENARRSHGVGFVGVGGAEEEEVAAYGDGVIEAALLGVGLAGEDEDGADGEGLHVVDVCGLDGGGEPGFVGAEGGEDGGEVLRCSGSSVLRSRLRVIRGHLLWSEDFRALSTTGRTWSKK
jgi:hypothetical protein